MTREQALEFLTSGDVGHLAVVDAGEPYVSPISYVVTDGTLYFRTRPGRRLSALRTAPRLCVEASVVQGEAGTWSSVCAWGDGAVLEDPNRNADVVALLLDKYADATESVLLFAKGPVFGQEAVVVAMPIDIISGRVSGAELGTQVRPGRL